MGFVEIVENGPRPFIDLTTGCSLSFGRGKFDDWCIYFYVPDDPEPKFPKDETYFASLAKLGEEFNRLTLYMDFVELYDKVTEDPTPQISVVHLLHEIASRYAPYSVKVENIFGILYAGMIAEEQKDKKILGKRIKRLGVHQVLVELVDPKIAANYSRGKRWSDLDIECKQRGF